MVLGELSTLFKCKTLDKVMCWSQWLFKLTLEEVVRYIPDLNDMILIGSYTLLAYSDDIILLGECWGECKKANIINKQYGTTY